VSIITLYKWLHTGTIIPCIKDHRLHHPLNGSQMDPNFLYIISYILRSYILMLFTAQEIFIIMFNVENSCAA